MCLSGPLDIVRCSQFLAITLRTRSQGRGVGVSKDQKFMSNKILSIWNELNKTQKRKKKSIKNTVFDQIWEVYTVPFHMIQSFVMIQSFDMIR